MKFDITLGEGVNFNKDYPVEADLSRIVLLFAVIDSRCMTVGESGMFGDCDICKNFAADHVEVSGNYLKPELPDHDPHGLPGSPGEIEDLEIVVHLKNGGTMGMGGLTYRSIDRIRADALEKMGRE